VHRLQRELAAERAQRQKVEQKLGGVTSVNKKLRALVLAFKANEAAERAKRAARTEARTAPS
jgi:hypothetical protein